MSAASDSSIVADILERLKDPNANLLELLKEHRQPGAEALWRNHVELFNAFARRLISMGQLTRAIELIRDGLEHHANEPELQYRIALAYARGGNIEEAEKHIQILLAVPDIPPALRADVYCLQANYYKNVYLQTKGEPSKRREIARTSADWYRRAFEVSKKLFPLINQATMTALTEDLGPPPGGGPAPSAVLAGEVLKLAKEQGPDNPTEAPYWFPATLAEAYVILRDFDNAFAHLKQAIALAKNFPGDLLAIRKNMQMLRDRVQNQPDFDPLLAEFQLGCVMVFAGHMIDPPKHYFGRFPNDDALVAQVREAIRKTLKERNVTVGFCSASCGADLLFAEEILKRNAELHVVLPFCNEDFFKTSVDFGDPNMKDWRRRFHDVLEQIPPRHVHYATKELYLGDDILFNFLNTVLHGLALIRASERGGEAHALVVFDQSLEPKEKHGTFDFMQKWNARMGFDPKVEDLAELRKAVSITKRPQRLGGPKRKGTGMRQIKAMLFADVKGFSKLPEELLQPFVDQFTKAVRAVLDRPGGMVGSSPSAPGAEATSPTKTKSRPKFPGLQCLNTWGDGLFMVFDDVIPAAEFALRLLEHIKAEKWVLPTMDKENKQELFVPALRVALHTGPVFEYRSPLLKRKDYFGSHVNRTARIEPVTLPGCAYTSEQFAAALEVRRGHHFACEFLGIEELAKDYDRCPLYRLYRR